MRRYFYIAIKCISSNLYTSDITDIAVLSNSTGELFHREIAVEYSLSAAACQYKYYKYSDTIQYTTGWYDKSTTGCTFSDVLKDLMYFLDCNTDSGTEVYLISHGGYHHTFPLLLANCLKYDRKIINSLKNCFFIDSMLQFKDIRSTGLSLESLRKVFNLKRYGYGTHTTRKVRLLRDILCAVPDVVLNHPYVYTFTDIQYYLHIKQKISIFKLLSYKHKSNSLCDFKAYVRSHLRCSNATFSYYEFSNMDLVCVYYFYHIM